MNTHGNSLENDKPHHLYQIEDTTEKDIFKYGISNEPIGEDGLSSRVRKQINFMNLVVGFVRFVGKILVLDIAGRKAAKELEDQYIDVYFEEKGKYPKGNLIGGKTRSKK